jgi:2-hydroxychromene-2-carboxylate isomerase
MTRTIDFYFDFPSPYAYLAHTQFPGIAAEHGARIVYHPFRILELMRIVGNRPTTIECKNKGKYASADLQRWVKRYKVDSPETRIRRPSTLPNWIEGAGCYR